MKYISRITSILIILGISLLFSADAADAGDKNTVYLGWAEVDITPDKPVHLRGQFYKRVSKYVRDPLSATVLAVETRDANGDNEQAIMVSCDQVTILKEIQDKIRSRVADKIPDFDGMKLFMNATHTHTAPSPELWSRYDTSVDEGVMTAEEFGEFMVDKIAGAVIKAWKSREPGGISYGLGHAVVGHNRRMVYDDGTAVMYGATDTESFKGIEGPSDHGVEMLFCWDLDNSLTGIVINVACPSQVVESKHYISADFWSEVRKELRKRYSEDIFIFPQCGAGGDQSPRDLPRRRRGEPNMYGEAGLVEIGRRIANAVDDVYSRVSKDIKTEIVFSHKVKNIRLPVWKVSQEDYEEAFAVYAIYEKLQESPATAAPVDFSKAYSRTMGFKKAIVDRYREQRRNPYYDFELHALRLGDVAFANNPFELYLEYALRMRARSKAEQTFVIQISGDEAGYLPTPQAIRGGGYSTHIYSCRVGPEGGKVLVDETVELINSMWE